ncbi:b-box zinc finger [Oesophagostomum dentatum]|uniref:B-box zinc finger n=1 Tax=Oesophagostomum dentatum TaxID=61180 RepID=A0A0B1TG69_OESDE|nr:b-box zinc finger [Oesophagostomum dentatum]
MEEELKCSHCRKFFDDPILLLCGHSYCRRCALKAQQPSSSVRPATPLGPPSHFPQILSSSPLSPHCSSSGASDTISVCISDPDHDSDKMSVLSEADSGVVCSRRICQKPTYYADEVAISNAPANMAIQNVISRYFAQHPQAAPKEQKQTTEDTKEPNCQLCEEKIRPATVFCEQCDIFYCQPCQIALHPPRGPLAKHTLVNASQRFKLCVYTFHGSASDTISVCISDPDHDSDKMSVLSEADSGVVCSRRICQKPTYYADEVAISNAPANMAIQNVISRYFAQHPQAAPKEQKQTTEDTKEPNCQLCEEKIRPATVFCEQCDIFYCQPCQIALHPPRGPLAKHTLVNASQRKSNIPATMSKL